MTPKGPGCLLLCPLVLWWTVSGVAAQTDKQGKVEEVFRLRTELVTLEAQIAHKKTQQIINGLRQPDFEIYDDGVKQEITHFSQDKLPLSVVLLLDASGSMWTALERMRANTLQVLQALKPEDEVAVFITAEETHLIQDFTKEKFRVAATLREVEFKTFGENGIFLNDSLYRAATRLQNAANPANRRVIIVVTDNITVPNINWKAFSKQEAVTLLLESGVVVCGLVINPNLFFQANNKLLRFPERRTAGDVHHYADLTGGEVISASNETIGQKLIELINHLRTRYSLAFMPSNLARDGKFRRLKVGLAAEAQQRMSSSLAGGYAIRTRSGYYAGKY